MPLNHGNNQHPSHLTGQEGVPVVPGANSPTAAKASLRPLHEDVSGVVNISCPVQTVARPRIQGATAEPSKTHENDAVKSATPSERTKGAGRTLTMLLQMQETGAEATEGRLKGGGSSKGRGTESGGRSAKPDVSVVLL